MLRKYIKDIIKTELAKQKLNVVYGNISSHNFINVWELENKGLKEKIKFLQNNNNILRDELEKEKSFIHSIDSHNYNELIKSKKLIEHLNKVIKKYEEDYLNLSNKAEEFKKKSNDLEKENEDIKTQLRKSFNSNQGVRRHLEMSLSCLTEENKKLKQDQEDIMFLIETHLTDSANFTTLFVLAIKIKSILTKSR